MIIMEKTYIVFMYESLEFKDNNLYLSDKKTKIVRYFQR